MGSRTGGKWVPLALGMVLCFFTWGGAKVEARMKTDAGADDAVVFRSLRFTQAGPEIEPGNAEGHGAGSVSASAEVSPESSEVESPPAEASSREIVAQASPQADTPAESEEVKPEAQEAPAPAEEAPPEAEEEKEKEEKEVAEEGVLIKKIVFKGNSVIDTATLEKATESFLGQELTFEDMGSIADMVTLAYQEKGYILAKAYIPEQEIKEGVLHINIVEGRVGKIEVAGNKYYNSRVIKRYFQSQLREGVIRESTLERGLLLTNEVPKTDTKIVLKRGEKPGTADVVLNTTDKIPLKFSIDWNNYGAEETGDERWGTRIEMTDPWWGNTLSLRGVTGNDPDDTKLATAELSIPVNTYGTRVLFNYLYANYAVGLDLTNLGIQGESRRYGVKAYHPLIKTGSTTFGVTGGYERRFAEAFVNKNVSTSIDKEDAWFLQLDLDKLDRFLGKTIVSLKYTHGRFKPDPRIPLSRIDAEKLYDKIGIDVIRVQKIYGYTNVMVRGSGQYTKDRLPSIEETAIGGYGTVRGHRPAFLLGDSGYIVTAELLFAPPFVANKVLFGQRIAQMAQIALFYDHGAVYINQRQGSEFDDEYIAGFGWGLRLYYKEYLRLKFDMAKPNNDKFQDDNKTTWYYFSFEVSFL